VALLFWAELVLFTNMGLPGPIEEMGIDTWTNKREEHGPIGEGPRYLDQWERGLDILTSWRGWHGTIGERGLNILTSWRGWLGLIWERGSDIWTTEEEAWTNRREGLRYLDHRRRSMDQ
jgi:hypothetical protein